MFKMGVIFMCTLPGLVLQVWILTVDTLGSLQVWTCFKYFYMLS